MPTLLCLANGPTPGEIGNLLNPQDDIVGINDEAPPHFHRTVLMCAIYGSPEKKLTLKELRLALRIRFPWYEKEYSGGGWEVSLTLQI